MNENTNVVGTDGHTPIYEPNSPFKIWSYDEIYLGQEGHNRYVPKVNDLVIHISARRFYRVIGINDLLIPQLVDWILENEASEESSDDILLQSGLDSKGETFRLFIDKSTIPYRCIIDQRCFTGALHASYAKVYRGNPYDGTQVVVSMLYDSSKQFVGHEVPLRSVAATKYNNQAIRTIEPFKTTYDLKNGEPVVVMYHGPEGEIISQRLLIVQESEVVDHLASDTRWISGISLDSPYLLESEPDVLELPINLTTNSLNALGIVHYTDGTSTTLPAQGGRFEILGMGDYIAGIPNLEIPITLKYNMVQGEVATSSHITNQVFITEPYTLRTGQAKNAYSVRLYGFPVWIDSANGYRLEWYLYNLERKTVYRVDHLVRYNTETNTGYDPTAYGVNQRISVSINLNDVSGQFNRHIHTQVMEILLQRQATEEGSPWVIKDAGSETLYGADCLARYEQVNQNLKYLWVDAGASSREEWLEKLYRNNVPLYDKFSEHEAPEPNFFIIEINDTVIEAPVSDWNARFQLSGAINSYENVNIKFVLRTSDNDLQLAMASMMVKHI